MGTRKLTTRMTAPEEDSQVGMPSGHQSSRRQAAVKPQSGPSEATEAPRTRVKQESSHSQATEATRTRVKQESSSSQATVKPQ